MHMDRKMVEPEKRAAYEQSSGWGSSPAHPMGKENCA